MRRTLMSLALGGLAALTLAGNAWSNGGGSGSITSTNDAYQSTQKLLYSTVGQCRDCWTGGVKLRASGSPAGGGASGTITVPPFVAANAVYAELFWVVLDDVTPPSGETFNGNALTRDDNGPVTGDPCWNTQFAYSYRANVLPFLTGGVNTLDHFPDNGVLGTGPNTEGATLVIVYATQTADKEVLVYGGNDLIDGFLGLTRSDLVLSPSTGPGVGAELTFVVGDGQSIFEDQALWDNIPLAGNNAFQGLDQGPGTTAGGGGYWDTETFGVATSATNTASVSIANVAAWDCLNWVATVFCVKKGGCVVPVEPSTWGGIKSLLH